MITADPGVRRHSLSFGKSVAICNDVVVVGMPYNNEGLSGCISAYSLDGTLLRSIVSPGEDADFFGYSVDLNDEVVAIGAPYEDMVLLYNLQTGQWIDNVQSPSIPDGYSQSWFGDTLKISGANLFVSSSISAPDASAQLHCFNLLTLEKLWSATDPSDSHNGFAQEVVVRKKDIVVASQLKQAPPELNILSISTKKGKVKTVFNRDQNMAGNLSSALAANKKYMYLGRATANGDFDANWPENPGGIVQSTSKGKIIKELGGGMFGVQEMGASMAADEKELYVGCPGGGGGSVLILNAKDLELINTLDVPEGISHFGSAVYLSPRYAVVRGIRGGIPWGESVLFVYKR